MDENEVSIAVLVSRLSYIKLLGRDYWNRHMKTRSFMI